MSHQISEKVAKIDNAFIVNAQYKMTAREQKILYYLISHLDPKNEQDFNSISIPIHEMEKILNQTDKKWGGFYNEIDELCKGLIRKHIQFPSNFLMNGKPLKGYLNWFNSIMPIQDENGRLCIKFSFSPDMKPFLLQLHHYVNIDVLEIVPMKNAHAIRMYSVFKSEKDRMKGVVNFITMAYSLDELKALLGIEDKYQSSDLKGFRDFVLNRIRDEINESCPTMFVKYDYIKTQRKVTGVKFSVYERKISVEAEESTMPKVPKPQKDVKDYMPTEKDIIILTRAKLMAYKALLNYGVFEGIAYKQILPKIKGSEFDGYEDFFVEKAMQHFEQNAIQNTTKELKTSTFVTWWTKNKVYEKGDVWANILEKLAEHKKQLLKKNPLAFENRIIAKTMTNAQFEEYVNGTKQETN